MKSFLRTFLAVVLANALLFLLLIGIAASKAKKPPAIQDGSVLIQTLDGEIPESAPAWSNPLGDEPVTHTLILENLEKARHDKRIRAVVLKIGSPAVGWAKMDEWRERIEQIRAAGKPVWAYTDILGRGALYLGSACDSLFLLPTGYVSLHGLAAEHPFIRHALDKLGVKPDLHRIEKYKSAAEIVLQDSMSAESKANVSWMLDAFYPQLTQTVESERHLQPGTLEQSVFAAGALAPKEALALGLVDRLLYWDEVEARLLRVAGVKESKEAKDAEKVVVPRNSPKDARETGAPGVVPGFSRRPRLVNQTEYARVDRKAAGIKGKKKIAVVHAAGTIAGEESGVGFPWGVTMGSATMEAAFRGAAEDKDVEAIIFRIDSGGGESHTSWKIQRAAMRASETKPLVVSMCDVAASGAYLIAYPFDELVANRMSVVGSIGSISGKFNLRGFYDKIGVTKDFVTRGPNALMDSDYFDFTPEQWAAFTRNHWMEYEDWVADIARYRHMTPAEVDSVGRGRVFTGEQALQRGLIDTLGTFDLAVALAKQKAGIPADQEVLFVHYPKKAGFLENLRHGGMTVAVLGWVDSALAPMRRTASWAIDENRYW